MRFLLCFPLPFLLILSSFVSVDAAPLGSFKPEPPWSTYKLKRSTDDSASPADYDSLSPDQLTTLLEETKKKAENEKTDLDSAKSALSAKQDEVNKANDDFNAKKTEWDRWSEQIKWKEAAEAADKLFNESEDEVRRLNGTVAGYEADLAPEYERVRIAQQNLDDLNDIDNVIAKATAEATRLADALTTEKAREPDLRSEKTSTGAALTSAKRLESTYGTNYRTQRCDDPRQAAVQPCSDTIGLWTAAKRALQTAQAAFDTADGAYQTHTASVRELDRQRKAADTIVRKLTAMKANPDDSRKDAETVLKLATADKDIAEKPLLEERELLREAEGRLADAGAAKFAADEKVRGITSDATSQAALAFAAFLKATERRDELAGELGRFQSAKDEKEKMLSETTAKVAELQQRTDKKGPVATGGMPLAAILGICVAAIFVIGGIIAFAAFSFVRRRKRLAMKQQAAAVEEAPAKEEVKQSVEKVASDQSKSSAKVESQPPVTAPVDAVVATQLDDEVACSDERQYYVGGRLVTENQWLALNNAAETTIYDYDKQRTGEEKTYFRKLKGKYCTELIDLIEGNIANVKKTPIFVSVTYQEIRCKMKKIGHLIASFDGHDSRIVLEATDFNILFKTEDGHKYEPKPSKGEVKFDLRIDPKMMLAFCIYSKISKRKEADAKIDACLERMAIAPNNRRDEYDERSRAGQEEEPVTAQPPTSEQQAEVTEKTQKTVTLTQQETGKEVDDTQVPRIPDEPVTGVLKDESKKEAIDESLVEKTAIDSSSKEPLKVQTGIRKTEPLKAEIIAGRRRVSGAAKKSRTGGSKNRKEKKESKSEAKARKQRGFITKLYKRLNRSKKRDSSSSSSSSDSVRTLREFVDKVQGREDNQDLSDDALEFLELTLSTRILDDADMNLLGDIFKRVLKQIGPKFYDGDRVILTKAGATIVTDIHGNMPVLTNVFDSHHTPTALAWTRHRFIFAGDYVDRGENSMQVYMFLCVLKLRYPENIIMLRGNHEDPVCNRGYGFDGELIRLFGENGRRSARSIDMRNTLTAVFARMPLAAVMGGRVLCVHGCAPAMDIEGLIDEINKLPKVIPDPYKYDLAWQILWNDPGRGVRGSEPSNLRGGSGKLIGADLVKSICKKNGFDAIVRGHQVAGNGYELFAGGKLILIFTSSKYHGNTNHGAVLDIAEDGRYGLRIFVNIDELGPNPSKDKIRKYFTDAHNRRWTASNLRTSEDNKANENQDDNVKKNAPQLEQADMSKYSITLVPTNGRDK